MNKESILRRLNKVNELIYDARYKYNSNTEFAEQTRNMNAADNARRRADSNLRDLELLKHERAVLSAKLKELNEQEYTAKMDEYNSRTSIQASAKEFVATHIIEIYEFAYEIKPKVRHKTVEIEIQTVPGRQQLPARRKHKPVELEDTEPDAYIREGKRHSATVHSNQKAMKNVKREIARKLLQHFTAEELMALQPELRNEIMYHMAAAERKRKEKELEKYLERLERDKQRNYERKRRRLQQ